MNIIFKKTLNALLIIFILLFIFSLFMNTLYYFDLINNTFFKYLKLILVLISFLIGGIYMGRNVPNKGYLYGLRLSSITSLILFIIALIYNNLNVSIIIYLILVTITITFGSMIGISKKIN